MALASTYETEETAYSVRVCVCVCVYACVCAFVTDRRDSSNANDIYVCGGAVDMEEKQTVHITVSINEVPCVA